MSSSSRPKSHPRESSDQARMEDSAPCATEPTDASQPPEPRATEAREKAGSSQPAESQPEDAQARTVTADSGRINVLYPTLLSLFVITFTVWIVFAWTDYGERYAQSPEFWARGTTRTIELTLIREDFRNLACASDLVIEGLHCSHRGNGQPFAPGESDERLILLPYNSVDNVLIFGAGLWSSPKLKQPLPEKRFSVVCDYHVVRAIRSASLRFSPKAAFTPLKRSAPMGTLSNCEIPP